jgi:hypothetical protein
MLARNWSFDCSLVKNIRSSPRIQLNYVDDAFLLQGLDMLNEQARCASHAYITGVGDYSTIVFPYGGASKCESEVGAHCVLRALCHGCLCLGEPGHEVVVENCVPQAEGTYPAAHLRPTIRAALRLDQTHPTAVQLDDSRQRLKPSANPLLRRYGAQVIIQLRGVRRR